MKKLKSRKKRLSFMIMAVYIGVCIAAFGGCGGGGEKKLPADLTYSDVSFESYDSEALSKSPAELDAYDVACIFMKKQSEFYSYEINSTGETVAKTIISYTQKIWDKTVKKGDVYYCEAVSSSALVKMKHQMAVKGERTAYRKDFSGELKGVSKSEYKNIFGNSPDDVALGGFEFNRQTVISAEKIEGTAENALSFRYVLDGEKGGTAKKRQMKEFGGLENYPVFTEVRLTLTITEEWLPVSLTVEAGYQIDIAVLGKTNCRQKLVSVYSDVCVEPSPGITFPDEQVFLAKIEG